MKKYILTIDIVPMKGNNKLVYYQLILYGRWRGKRILTKIIT